MKIPFDFRIQLHLSGIGKKKREHLTGGAIGCLKQINSKTGADGMTSGFENLSEIYSATISRRDISPAVWHTLGFSALPQ